MKTLTKLLFVAFSLLFVLACSKSSDDLLSVDLKSGNLGADKTHETKMVTVPFKANFTVWRALPPGTGECGEGSARETMMMKGEGDATHLGQIQEIFMTFCTAPTPDVILPINYWFVETGKFVAANGDELHFVIESGQIMPYTGDDSKYQLRFDDDMVFIGGTGRFEGASGSAKTNAYVHAGSNDNDGEDPFYTDFIMNEGTLTLVKGK